MIVVDTSAFVSLEVAGSLSLVLEEFDVHTTESVMTELEETASHDDVHGLAAESVLEKRESFSRHPIEEPTLETSRIDTGEASCVRCCQQFDAEFLITDDFRALPELQRLTAARVAISPIVLEALVKRDVLEKQAALERLEAMAENRDWLGSPIYRRAQRLFDQ